MDILKTANRDLLAKPKALRREGLVPGCIYGSHLEQTLPIQIEQPALEKLLRGKGIGSKLTLELGDQTMPVLIKDVARSALNSTVEHIGFQALEADRKVNSVVRILLLNREMISGVVEQVLFELPYTSLPKDIVESVTLDMMGYTAGARITVADLEIAKNENVELLVDPDSIVVTINDNRRAAPTGPAADA